MRKTAMLIVLACTLVMLFSFSRGGELTPAYDEQEQKVVVVPVMKPIILRERVVEERVVEVVKRDDQRQLALYYGMDALARTEHLTIGQLMLRWGEDPELAWELAGWYIEAADAYHLDEFDLAAMGWKESRWNPSVEGDCGCYKGTKRIKYAKERKTGNKVKIKRDICAHMKNTQWICVSCGIMQANMGVKKKKWGMTCQQAKSNPRQLILSSAEKLSTYRNEKGQLQLYKYNCPSCERISKYEWQARRDAELARTYGWLRVRARNKLVFAVTRLVDFTPLNLVSDLISG